MHFHHKVAVVANDLDSQKPFSN